MSASSHPHKPQTPTVTYHLRQPSNIAGSDRQSSLECKQALLCLRFLMLNQNQNQNGFNTVVSYRFGGRCLRTSDRTSS